MAKDLLPSESLEAWGDDQEGLDEFDEDEDPEADDDG